MWVLHVSLFSGCVWVCTFVRAFVLRVVCVCLPVLFFFFRSLFCVQFSAHNGTPHWDISVKCLQEQYLCFPDTLHHTVSLHCLHMWEPINQAECVSSCVAWRQASFGQCPLMISSPSAVCFYRTRRSLSRRWVSQPAHLTSVLFNFLCVQWLDLLKHGFVFTVVSCYPCNCIVSDPVTDSCSFLNTCVHLNVLLYASAPFHLISNISQLQSGRHPRLLLQHYCHREPRVCVRVCVSVLFYRQHLCLLLCVLLLHDFACFVFF